MTPDTPPAPATPTAPRRPATTIDATVQLEALARVASTYYTHAVTQMIMIGISHEAQFLAAAVHYRAARWNMTKHVSEDLLAQLEAKADRDFEAALKTVTGATP